MRRTTPITITADFEFKTEAHITNLNFKKKLYVTGLALLNFYMATCNTAT